MDKKAYETFVSIVRNDYYIPGSWVAARNANSPVNMGLNGHRLNPGEYGYRGERPFHPFEGARYGRFDSFLDGFRAKIDFWQRLKSSWRKMNAIMRFFFWMVITNYRQSLAR